MNIICGVKKEHAKIMVFKNNYLIIIMSWKLQTGVQIEHV